MFFGKDDLAKDLTALGVADGDGLFVHTALGKIGKVIGGPHGLIEALIYAVGDTGLIAMPGFSRDAYDPVALSGAKVSPEDHERLRDPVLRKAAQFPRRFTPGPGQCVARIRQVLSLC